MTYSGVPTDFQYCLPDRRVMWSATAAAWDSGLRLRVEVGIQERVEGSPWHPPPPDGRGRLDDHVGPHVTVTVVAPVGLFGEDGRVRACRRPPRCGATASRPTALVLGPRQALGDPLGLLPDRPGRSASPRGRRQDLFGQTH